jgi:hypothetical protein
MAEDQSVSTVTLHMTFPTELVERLKVSLGNLDKKRSASEAIREAIDKIIAETGAVTVRQAELRELSSRTGVPLPRSSRDIVKAFEAASSVGPYTLHVEIDPGVVEQIKQFAQDTGMTFTEQCRMIIEESAVDKFMYACSDRVMRFPPKVWKSLCEVLEVEKVPSASELVLALKKKLNGVAVLQSG